MCCGVRFQLFDTSNNMRRDGSQQWREVQSKEGDSNMDNNRTGFGGSPLIMGAALLCCAGPLLLAALIPLAFSAWAASSSLVLIAVALVGLAAFGL